MTIIGGADGPTTIFLADDISFINTLGLIIVVLMLIPNIIYFIRHRDAENKCTNRLMNILEQVGRYGSMLLMVFNIGLAEFGFASVEAFLCYALGNAALIIAYFVFWAIYSKKHGSVSALMLAILPSLIFILSGITLRHYLLVAFALLFSVCHIYVTRVNTEKEE